MLKNWISSSAKVPVRQLSRLATLSCPGSSHPRQPGCLSHTGGREGAVGVCTAPGCRVERGLFPHHQQAAAFAGCASGFLEGLQSY